MLLTDLFPGRSQDQMQQFSDHMARLMSEAGLPWARHREKTYNSRLAQEMAAWADTTRPGTDLHDRLYKAYFVDHANLADKDTLVQIAAASGLDSEAARSVLDQRSFSEHIDRDWYEARISGVTGVPTFRARDLFVVGCQPFEILERFVNHLKTIDD